jgi:hypothetical protein
VLFLHGNAGNVSHRLEKIQGLLGLGAAVLVVDWRGFGRSGGRPSDAGLLRDAVAAADEMERLTRGSGRPRGLYGESIGCLPAVRLAAAGTWAFLILEGSFPGKRSLAAGYPLWWPFLPFISRTLDMGDRPSRITLPVLVLHAADDEIAPLRLGRQVARRFGPRATLRIMERGGHNDFFAEDPGFFPAVADFLEGLPGQAGPTRGGGDVLPGDGPAATPGRTPHR